MDLNLLSAYAGKSKAERLLFWAFFLFFVFLKIKRPVVVPPIAIMAAKTISRSLIGERDQITGPTIRR
jgi:hypothetical protein